jgi:hypothetical protein
MNHTARVTAVFIAENFMRYARSGTAFRSAAPIRYGVASAGFDFGVRRPDAALFPPRLDAATGEPARQGRQAALRQGAVEPAHSKNKPAR